MRRSSRDGQRPDVVIIGSGFAGTILARVLRRERKRVVLIEKGTHPRFALGESTTPLANLALERMAARYRMSDLHQLAAYGRWLDHLPHLRRGLKRGFSFYHHRYGQPFVYRPDNANRLLVAANPTDRSADSHWLRSDVDHHLVQMAQKEGVVYRDQTRVDSIDIDAERVLMELTTPDGHDTLESALVVDASGPGGVLATALDLPSQLDRVPFATGLLSAHMTGVRHLPQVTTNGPADDAPYAEERAAVHHLLDIGWLYVLRFDHGPASVGLVLRHDAETLHQEQLLRDPERAFRRLLVAYPSLSAMFRQARAVTPMTYTPRLQYRLSVGAGERWFLLPHAYAFFDPLFSTGMAWSLNAVERIASIVEGRHGDWRAYSLLLHQEAEHLQRLIEAAYLAMPDFDNFRAVAALYFAAASFAETRQRLLPGARNQPDAWDALLGARDPVLASLVVQTRDRLRDPQAIGTVDWVVKRLSSRDIMGLDDPPRPGIYPVDLEVLQARSHLLGLTPEDVFAALPRLRGED